MINNKILLLKQSILQSGVLCSTNCGLTWVDFPSVNSRYAVPCPSDRRACLLSDSKVSERPGKLQVTIGSQAENIRSL